VGVTGILLIVVPAAGFLVAQFWLWERARDPLIRFMALAYVAATACLVLFSTGQIGS
jgi:uncharacterized membrane protein YbaN (DUF454 family)